MKKIDTTIELVNVSEPDVLFDYMIKGQTSGLLCSHDVCYHLFDKSTCYDERPQEITVRITSAKPRNKRPYTRLLPPDHVYDLWRAYGSNGYFSAILRGASKSLTDLFGTRALYAQAVKEFKE